MKFIVIFLISFFSVASYSHTKIDTIQKNKKAADSISKWKVRGQISFVFNQSSFTNWKSGGDNTIAANVGINYDFNYKSDNWHWDNKIITAYGGSQIQDKGTRKTTDAFEYNSLLGKRTKNNWYLSFFTNFKTQYAEGLNYKKNPHERISDFLSPAYLSFGPGMLLKKSNKFNINIAPASARYTFVSPEFSGKYGVEEGDTYDLGLGFNLSSYYKFLIMKNFKMENILTVYSDYLNNPQNIDIDYQANFFVSVNKYMSMNIALRTLVDDDASSKVQFKELFGLGIKYVFHEL